MHRFSVPIAPSDGNPKIKARVSIFTFLVLTLLLGVTVALFMRERRHADARFREIFESRVADVANRVRVNQELLGGVLRGLQGFFSGSEEVTRADFRAYVSRLNVARNLPGVQGIGLAIAIRNEPELEAKINEIRAEGFAEFDVSPRQPKRDFYTSIVFLEPLSGRNWRAFGFDMFSEEVRRNAMERAWLEDSLALSGKVTLRQETAEKTQAGTLLYAPIFQKGPADKNLEWRRAHLVGWVYMPFRMDDLMDSVLALTGSEQDVRIRIYDGGATEPVSLLHDSQNFASEESSETTIGPLLRTTRSINLYGREWTLEVASLPLLEKNLSYRMAYAVLVIGIILSASLVFIVYLLLGREERATHLAIVRTTALHAKQLELQTERDNVNLLLAGIAAGVIKYDAHGEIVFINKAAETILGYDCSSVVGKHLSFVWQENTIDCVVDSRTFECSLRRTDGKVIMVSGARTRITDSQGMLFTVLTFNDITERQQMEQQLEQQRAVAQAAAKMASLGVMAGGIAHEINTPLAIIQSRSSRLIEIITSRNQPEHSDVIVGLQKIEMTTKRIANIVRGLRAFSRDSKNDPKSVLSMSSILGDARQLCQDKVAMSDVDLSFDLAEDGVILGRQDQIMQIIVNLVNNGMDAVRDLQERWVRVLGEVQGKQLIIRVIDSGSGIPAAVVEKMMDPFFSTKPVGKGTGLGLSISLGIAREHGGELYYDRNCANTTFVLRLPVHEVNSDAVADERESA